MTSPFPERSSDSKQAPPANVQSNNIQQNKPEVDAINGNDKTGNIAETGNKVETGNKETGNNVETGNADETGNDDGEDPERYDDYEGVDSAYDPANEYYDNAYEDWPGHTTGDFDQYFAHASVQDEVCHYV